MTSPTAAEMIKYASNSLLATLISFSNEVSRVCESIKGLDVEDVWRGVHLDRRLTPNKQTVPEIVSYIRSGCGYGGSCLPKDTQALLSFMKNLRIDSNILNSVIHTNETQPHRLIMLAKNAIGQLKGKRIVVFGLAFKPNTDDLRESPGLKVIQLLIKEGARVYCHDPIISEKQLRQWIPNRRVKLEHEIIDTLKDSDVAIFTTAWDAYKKLKPISFKKYMKTPNVIDGRRMFDRQKCIKEGVLYQGIGYKA